MACVRALWCVSDTCVWCVGYVSVACMVCTVCVVFVCYAHHVWCVCYTPVCGVCLWHVYYVGVCVVCIHGVPMQVIDARVCCGVVCAMHVCVVCVCGACVHVHVPWRRQRGLRTGLGGRARAELLEPQAGWSLSSCRQKGPAPPSYGPGAGL